ncbi:hypothetical protein [Rhizobium bangladeshense]|uniref:hypothetical protein n=1 Tax=Rhizobium bangladeshense TaxID=1138189 RepID=UPI002180C110|nr:hypothetical protein [Rhizobium bangladeshense]
MGALSDLIAVKGEWRGKRKVTTIEVSTSDRWVHDLRRLRNRIAHYEPILAQPIAVLHQDILNITALLSVDAAAWITAHSTVNYPSTPIIVPHPKSGVSIFDQALIAHLPV